MPSSGVHLDAREGGGRSLARPKQPTTIEGLTSETNQIFETIADQSANYVMLLRPGRNHLDCADLVQLLEIAEDVRPCLMELEVCLQEEIKRRLKTALYGDWPAHQTGDPIQQVGFQTVLDNAGCRHKWFVIVPTTDLPEDQALENLFNNPPRRGRPANSDGGMVFVGGHVYVPKDSLVSFSSWVEERNFSTERVQGLIGIGEDLDTDPEEALLILQERSSIEANCATILELRGSAVTHYRTIQELLRTIGSPTHSSDDEKRRAATQLPDAMASLVGVIKQAETLLEKVRRAWSDFQQILDSNINLLELVTREMGSIAEAEQAVSQCQAAQTRARQFLVKLTETTRHAILIHNVISDEGGLDPAFQGVWEQVCAKHGYTEEQLSGAKNALVATFHGARRALHREPSPEYHKVSPTLMALARQNSPVRDEVLIQDEPAALTAAPVPAPALGKELVIEDPAPAPADKDLIPFEASPADVARSMQIDRGKVIKRRLADLHRRVTKNRERMGAMVSSRSVREIVNAIQSLSGPSRQVLTEEWGVILFDLLFDSCQVFLKAAEVVLERDQLLIRVLGSNEDLKWITEKTGVTTTDFNKGEFRIVLENLGQIARVLSAEQKQITPTPRLQALRQTLEA